MKKFFKKITSKISKFITDLWFDLRGGQKIVLTNVAATSLYIDFCVLLEQMMHDKMITPQVQVEIYERFMKSLFELIDLTHPSFKTIFICRNSMVKDTTTKQIIENMKEKIMRERSEANIVINATGFEGAIRKSKEREL